MRIAYDLHLHSCLSPCGDRDMTPSNLVNMARLAGLDCIALTDHNSCLNVPAARKAAEGTGLTVVPGMELCTAEEAHVVCLLPTEAAALEFSAAVRRTLPDVENRPEIFGEQLILDEEEGLLGQEELLLATASSLSVDQVLPLVRSYGGTAFPAHIDRPSYSVTASLGDIPPVGFAAAELTVRAEEDEMLRRYPLLAGMLRLVNSDAHYLLQIPDACPWIELADESVREMGSALAVISALDGRAPCRLGRS